MLIFGIHWNWTGGNSSQLHVTVLDEPTPETGKWEVEEAYNQMKRPTTELMTLTTNQCHDLINMLKQALVEQGVKDSDTW